MDEQAAELHRFWFGERLTSASPDAGARKRWFGGGGVFDGECRSAFGALLVQALAGGFTEWETEPRSALALVLLLDQLPRNVYRGTAQAFAGDARALAVATALVDSGDDGSLLPIERTFVYMPFEHAEDLAVQERSVALFRALHRAAPPEQAAEFAAGLGWAERHRDTIRRFGRFPARNEALGRETTESEAAFLLEHPTGF